MSGPGPNATSVSLNEIVVDWAQWLEDRDKLNEWRNSDEQHSLTVVVTTELPIDHPQLGSLLTVDKVAVNIESFTDGRVFGLGRLFREKLGFTGELQASGDYLPDQVSFLTRCGFNSFSDTDMSNEVFDYYSGFYQPPRQELDKQIFIRQARLERKQDEHE